MQQKTQEPCQKRKRDDESDDLVLVSVATHYATPSHYGLGRVCNAQLTI